MKLSETNMHWIFNFLSLARTLCIVLYVRPLNSLLKCYLNPGPKLKDLIWIFLSLMWKITWYIFSTLNEWKEWKKSIIQLFETKSLFRAYFFHIR